MSSERKTYRIVFSGKIADGYTVDTVKETLRARLKISPEKVDALFEGRKTVFKRNLDLEGAEKFVQSLRRAGLLVHMEPEDDAPGSSLPVPSPDLPGTDWSQEEGKTHRQSPVLVPSRSTSMGTLAAGLVIGLIIGYLVFDVFRTSVVGLSPEERAEVAALGQELTTIQSEITAAQEEDAKLSGGLIKVLISLRIETLKGTEAVVQQRIRALESGTRVTAEVAGVEPDPALAKTLENEISEQERKLAEAQAEAARYSGGLIQAITLSAVATQKQSLAMLRMRHLSAKYGIPVLAANATSDTPVLTSNLPTALPTKAPHPPAAMTEYDGPLGLKMGLGLDFFGDTAVEVAPGKYIVQQVPKPHHAFDSYGVKIGPTSGLCWVKAIGGDIETNSYGHQLQSAFDDMEIRLDTLYGNHKRTDRILPGSIWKEQRDWMMALKQSDRYLMSTWSTTSGATLPKDIETIALAASAHDTGTGYIAVEYTFRNKALCDAEVTSGADESL